MRRKTLRSTAPALLLAAASSVPLAAASHRLSLPPQSAHLFNNASVHPSGYNGALNLPPAGNPGFSFGFTLPEDYKKNTPITVSVIVDSAATGCDFTMLARGLMRARAGAPGDQGEVDAGLEAVSATTPFAVADAKKTLTFAAAPTAYTAVGLEFRIVATAGEFGPLRPGDAALFTLVRFSDADTDTCDVANLSVGGVAIVYKLRKSPQKQERGRLSLDPFTAFNSENPDLIEWNGLEPPLRLVNAPEAGAAFGFVVPEDHQPQSPLDVEILWSTASTGCSFVLSPGFLFRSRAGRGADHAAPGNSASSGLEPLSASTPFVLDGDDIEVEAPATAHETARLAFRIASGGGFPALRAGDAVGFGVFRRDGDAKDTCAADLSIAGVSVAYDRKSGEAAAVRRRISLDPYAAAAAFAAAPLERRDSGFDPALAYPGGAAANQSDFATGFVIPDDYRKNTPLIVGLLVSSQETGCEFVLQSNGHFRARPGHPRDFGNAAGGLDPTRATTAFTDLGPAIRFAAPAAGKTARVEFEITPTPGEFPTLEPGDAVNFGIFRRPGEVGETCAGELGVAGLSVLYTTK